MYAKTHKNEWKFFLGERVFIIFYHSLKAQESSIKIILKEPTLVRVPKRLHIPIMEPQVASLNIKERVFLPQLQLFVGMSFICHSFFPTQEFQSQVKFLQPILWAYKLELDTS